MAQEAPGNRKQAGSEAVVGGTRSLRSRVISRRLLIRPMEAIPAIAISPTCLLKPTPTTIFVRTVPARVGLAEPVWQRRGGRDLSLSLISRLPRTPLPLAAMRRSV